MIHIEMVVHVVEPLTDSLDLDRIGPGIHIGQKRLAAQRIAQESFCALKEGTLVLGHKDIELNPCR